MTGRGLTILWLLAVGCDRFVTTSDPPAAPAIRGRAPMPRIGHIAELPDAPLPGDAAGVLAELAPVPDRALVIVYDVTGPAGMSGTLEVLAAEGGYRRDNWAITLPLPDGPREIRGSAVQTPTAAWRAEGETAGTVLPGRLGDVAAAIVALDPVARTAVLTQIREWRDELATARAEDPGERETVAGISCVRVRAGGGEVCTWEEAGLPLRYDGATFSIVAAHVERGASLGMHAFDIPADAARTPLQLESRNLAPQLAAIAAGDRAQLLRLLVVDSFPALSAVRDGA